MPTSSTAPLLASSSNNHNYARPNPVSQNSTVGDTGSSTVPVVPDGDIKFDTGYDGKQRFSFRQLWFYLGPGFLMSVAYLDPGNIESNLQAGALGGYSLLWVLWWSTVLGAALQILCARLGVVTGQNLAQHCRTEYRPTARYSLWLLTELAIIGSDVQEVVGSAIALQLLTNGWIPIWAGVLITALDTFTFLLIENCGIRKLEAVFITVIALMTIAFGAEYILAGPDLESVLYGTVVPILPRSLMMQAAAMVGAVIMPHNLFLHSALVTTRNVDCKNHKAVSQANFYNEIETVLALLLSFIVNACVVGVFAQGFYGQSWVDPHIIGLNNAGVFLGERFGRVALLIWGFGLLAAGQLATMMGTYAGQYVMDGFLSWKIPMWKRVLITRSIAIVPAILVALLAFEYMDLLNMWLSVLQSILLPFALLPVLTFTSDPKLMGPYANKGLVRPVLIIVASLVTALNIGLVFAMVSDLFGPSRIVYTVVSVAVAAYLVSLGLLYMHRTQDKSQKSSFGDSNSLLRYEQGQPVRLSYGG